MLWMCGATVLCALLVCGRGQNLPKWYQNSRARLQSGNASGLEAHGRRADLLKAGGARDASMEPDPTLNDSGKDPQPENDYATQPEGSARSGATAETSAHSRKASKHTRGFQSSVSAVDVQLKEGDEGDVTAKMPRDKEDDVLVDAADPGRRTNVSGSGESAGGANPTPPNSTEILHSDSGPAASSELGNKNSLASWAEETTQDVAFSKPEPRTIGHKLMNMFSEGEPAQPEPSLPNPPNPPKSSVSGHSAASPEGTKQQRFRQTAERDGQQRPEVTAWQAREGGPVRQSYPATHTATGGDGRPTDVHMLALQPNNAAGPYDSPFRNSAAGWGGHEDPSVAGMKSSPDGVHTGRFMAQEDSMPANEYGGYDGGSNVARHWQKPSSGQMQMSSLYSYLILRRILQAIAFALANYQWCLCWLMVVLIVLSGDLLWTA